MITKVGHKVRLDKTEIMYDQTDAASRQESQESLANANVKRATAVHMKAHDVDWHNGCEVLAIFVCPRWPSAAILVFIEPQIVPFDPPTPKTLA